MARGQHATSARKMGSSPTERVRGTTETNTVKEGTGGGYHSEYPTATGLRIIVMAMTEGGTRLGEALSRPGSKMGKAQSLTLVAKVTELEAGATMAVQGAPAVALTGAARLEVNKTQNGWWTKSRKRRRKSTRRRTSSSGKPA